MILRREIDIRNNSLVNELIRKTNGKVVLQIEALVTQYGVFYTSGDRNRYYSTFDGNNYMVNLGSNRFGVPITRPVVVAAETPCTKYIAENHDVCFR